MKALPDNAFDLAIVDPPYGIGCDKKKSWGTRNKTKVKTTYKPKNWDIVPNKSYFDNLFRVSKNTIIFGANYFVNYLPPSKCWIVYDKRQNVNVSFAMAELAYTSFDKSCKMYSASRAYIQNNKNHARIHPTQKPVELYKWILNIFAKPGNRILDTHLGSGSIAIACHDLGFDLVGCEIDADYHAAAKARLDDIRSHTPAPLPLR